MEPANLANLGIDVEQLTMAVDFHEAYARLALSELPNQKGRTADDGSWVGHMDAASALRQAGQLSLLVDPARSRRLLIRAGRLFHAHGYGFGAFLRVAAADETLWRRREGAEESLGQLIASLMPDARSRIAVPEPLIHPQQQAYMLLATASMVNDDIAGSDFIMLLRDAVDAAPQRLNITPVGAVGTPMRRYWDIGRVLLDYPNKESATKVAELVSEISTAYARDVGMARVNEYLWNHASAPVDIVDIDVVGLAAVSARRLGAGAVISAMEERLQRLSPLGRIPIRAAIDLIQLTS